MGSTCEAATQSQHNITEKLNCMPHNRHVVGTYPACSNVRSNSGRVEAQLLRADGPAHGVRLPQHTDGQNPAWRRKYRACGVRKEQKNTNENGIVSSGFTTSDEVTYALIKPGSSSTEVWLATVTNARSPRLCQQLSLSNQTWKLDRNNSQHKRTYR